MGSLHPKLRLGTSLNIVSSVILRHASSLLDNLHHYQRFYKYTFKCNIQYMFNYIYTYTVAYFITWMLWSVIEYKVNTLKYVSKNIVTLFNIWKASILYVLLNNETLIQYISLYIFNIHQII